MRLSLAYRISIAIVGVLALAVLSSVVAISSAYRFEAFQQTLVAENLESVRAAEELEIALLEQRGYVSSYILDRGNESWLEQLRKRRKDFDDWLVRANETARSTEERHILDQLKVVHQEYALQRDEVVRLYAGGDEEQARLVLLRDVTRLYQRAYDLCEEFIAANELLVNEATGRARREVEQITVLVTVMLLVTVALGIALLWLFFRGVIIPLQRIAADARSAAGDRDSFPGDGRTDELRELGHYVQLLMTNVAETRSDLERSRTQLAHADKLAAVGKLAASVAHEIRNPLTAVKMWLYSLRRGIEHDNEVRHKFEIVSDEIARLESIVSNFLEFAKPPKLKLESQAVAPLVDKTIELLRYRLEDQQIKIERSDESELPRIMVDSEQLRQVLVNLLNNAIEAMVEGGVIRISCASSKHAGRQMVVIRVFDSGTGIAPDVQQRIFEPFFSTKEVGTGLGLCIAASVMARHHGLVELESTSSQGSGWAVWIPTAASS